MDPISIVPSVFTNLGRLEVLWNNTNQYLSQLSCPDVQLLEISVFKKVCTIYYPWIAKLNVFKNIEIRDRDRSIWRRFHRCSHLIDFFIRSYIDMSHSHRVSSFSHTVQRTRTILICHWWLLIVALITQSSPSWRPYDPT